MSRFLSTFTSRRFFSDLFGSKGKFGGAAAIIPAATKNSVYHAGLGKKATLSELSGNAYDTDTSNNVTLAPFLTRAQGDSFGLYHGVIAPGGRIGREIHASNTETIYVIDGEGRGFLGEPKNEFNMKAGDIMHVEKNQYHGLANTGKTNMRVIVVGNPDY